MIILPGQLAFFIMLSIVPIITLIGFGASFFDISMESLVTIIESFFSKSVANLITPTITGQTLDFNLFFLLIIMFYIASNGADSLIVTFNQINGIKQSSWIKRRIKAILLTVLFVILFLFIIIVPIFGTKIIDALDYFHLKTIISKVLQIMQGPISWGVIFVFIKIIFMMAPDKSLPGSITTPGALFTTIAWIIITEIYGYYIVHLARYDLFYAGLSNIAVLMLWLYLLAYTLVIGISLNAKIDNDEMEKTGKLI